MTRGEVNPELRAAARAAFPGIDYWGVFDQAAADRDYMIPLETAPDDVILSQADWCESEGGITVLGAKDVYRYPGREYAATLRAFVQWRRRRHLTVVG